MADSYKWAIQKLQDGYNAQHAENNVWFSMDYKDVAKQDVSPKRVQMPSALHDAIIAEAYASKYETGLAFDIARSMGLRVSEISNLRMQDFIFSNGELRNIRIYKSKGRKKQNSKY